MINNKKEQTLKESLRLFQCARCLKQVKICTRCDRGNIYCSRACSIAARKSSCRAATKRYQRTPRGKQNHANCQQRYREKQQAKIRAKMPKVIDHGSLEIPRDLCSPTIDEVDSGRGEKQLTCDFCRRKCHSYLRWNFLNHYRRIRVEASSSAMAFAQGP